MPGQRGESKTSPRRIAAAERQKKALQLRIAGANFDQIAEQLDYASKGGAYESVMAALRKLPEVEVAEYRRLNLERLNRLRFAVWRQAQEGHLGAVDRELKIQEREAKLLGLDAKVEVDLTSGGKPITFTLKADGDADGDQD